MTKLALNREHLGLLSKAWSIQKSRPGSNCELLQLSSAAGLKYTDARARAWDLQKKGLAVLVGMSHIRLTKAGEDLAESHFNLEEQRTS